MKLEVRSYEQESNRCTLFFAFLKDCLLPAQFQIPCICYILFLKNMNIGYLIIVTPLSPLYWSIPIEMRRPPLNLKRLPNTSLATTNSSQSTRCPFSPLFNRQADITVMIQNLLILRNTTLGRGLSCNFSILICSHPNSGLFIVSRSEGDFATPFPPHIGITGMIRQAPERMHSTQFWAPIPSRKTTRRSAAELGVQRVQHPSVVS